ncbi:MAG: hypothetical protein JJU45_13920 [Acidimicrobiia bacterium]|nr:hypothetical protein [Acidimicrobiia bacterium]
MPHATFETLMTPPDDNLVSALGVAVVDTRVISVQVTAVELIDQDTLLALLDAAADRLP